MDRGSPGRATGRLATRAVFLTILRWTLLSLFVVGLLAGFALGSRPGSSQLVMIPIAVYAGVGAVVTGRQPKAQIGWLYLGVGALAGLAAFADGATLRAVADHDPEGWLGVLAAWIEAWFWFPLFAFATLFTILLFPSGLAGPRWRPVLWTSVAASSLLTVGVALEPVLVVGESVPPPCPAMYTFASDDGTCQIEVHNPLNPWSLSPSDAMGAFIVAGLVIVLAICLVLAVVSAVLRTRRAHGVERQQMRWLALSAGTFVSWMLLDAMVLHTSPPWSDVVFALLLAFIPLSCGFAITRYHLYDIDRIVSRTVSYGVVTGLLLLTYSVIVTSVSMILGSQSVVAIALATLVAAALVQPVLRRVQRVVDRRFDRSRYDAVHTIEAFGLRLRDAVDPKSTGDELLDVVAQTMSPSASGLWMRGPASRASSADG